MAFAVNSLFRSVSITKEPLIYQNKSKELPIFIDRSDKMQD